MIAYQAYDSLFNQRLALKNVMTNIHRLCSHYLQASVPHIQSTETFESGQLELFSSTHAVAEAMDQINDKYGEFMITPVLMMGMDDTIIDRIAYGGVKELEELYQQ